MMVRTILRASLLALVAIGPATAASFQGGMAAFHRNDYAAATRMFQPLAESGDARAQAIFGYMFATGRGVPQSYVEAAVWYRRAAEQGHPTAQYMLGLAYDKGQGVPQDYVEAYKWLDLAVGRASGRTPRRLGPHSRRGRLEAHSGAGHRRPAPRARMAADAGALSFCRRHARRTNDRLRPIRKIAETADAAVSTFTSVAARACPRISAGRRHDPAASSPPRRRWSRRG